MYIPYISSSPMSSQHLAGDRPAFPDCSAGPSPGGCNVELLWIVDIMGVSIVMGVSPNGWFLWGKIPLKMGDDWGYPYDSGNPHIPWRIRMYATLMLTFGVYWWSMLPYMAYVNPMGMIYMGVFLSHRATPSYYPFRTIGIFQDTNQLFWGTPIYRNPHKYTMYKLSI